MKVKALKSFTGAVCMSVGEVTNITDEVIANDLVNAGYVECLDSEPPQETPTENVSDSDTKKNATSKRSAKKDENKSDPKE